MGTFHFFARKGANWYDSGLTGMINYILLYRIRRAVKKILKDKIADDEIATTPKSCIGCLADDISWEIYYLIKEKEDGNANEPGREPAGGGS